MKLFQKHYQVPTRRRLITRFLNETTSRIDMERQRAFEQHQEQMEAQERWADSLFENNIMHKFSRSR
jgi:hypothetical protein